jgi:hypothetical protein
VLGMKTYDDLTLGPVLARLAGLGMPGVAAREVEAEGAVISAAKAG